MDHRHRTITELLHRIESGDQASYESLLSRAYDELHALARGFFRDQRPGHTLQPTALVHEAWMRLDGDVSLRATSREQFFALAAQIMRRLLIDHARAASAQKRGGGWDRVTLTGIGSDPQSVIDVMALDEALTGLEAHDAEAARVAELRYFGGLTNEAVGLVTGLSRGAVDRRWRMARAWLLAALEEPASPTGGDPA